MINSFKNKLLGQNEMYLHKQKVEIAKLTPVKWKQLFGTVDKLPGLILQVTATRPEDFYMTVLQAFDIALDEVIQVVSVLSEVDEEYISNHVGLDEITEYLTRMVKLNRLDKAVKNVKSLLPNQQQIR